MQPGSPATPVAGTPTWKTREPPMPARPQKSLAVAYVLWFFFGLFGVHRFYLGNWFTGTLYALSAGFYFVGWFLDLFMLPFLVNSSNQRLRERELSRYEDDEVEDELVLTPVEETVGGPPRLPRKTVKVRALPPPLWCTETALPDFRVRPPTAFLPRRAEHLRPARLAHGAVRAPGHHGRHHDRVRLSGASKSTCKAIRCSRKSRHSDRP